MNVSDSGIPLSAILTSASVHDSQVAIPLMQMTAERVKVLYDLADAAYDAPEIKMVSEMLGHVPIIESQQTARGGKGTGTRFADSLSCPQRSGTRQLGNERQLRRKSRPR